VNGCLVSGMLTPTTKSAFTYPKSLSQDILSLVPGYKILTTQEIFNLKGLKHFLDELIDTEKKRTQVMSHLLQKHPWDLGMIHFQSVDVLQHAVFWYLDPENPLYNPKKHELIKNFYRIIDESIGELLAQLPASTTTIVMSDHGSIPVRKMIHLNVLLSQRGWLSIQRQNFKYRSMQAIAATLRDLDILNSHRLVLGRKRRRVRERITEGSLIDWRKTKAFVINGWTYGNIYINLKGREKAGIVSEADYEELRKNIIEALYELKDPEGNGVVEHVYKNEELYLGQFCKDAPDLIVQPKAGYEFSSTIFQRKSVFKELKPRRGHLGNHGLNGIFAFNGDALHADTLKGIRDNRAHIVDLFPTILYMLGLKIPDYTDGTILEWLFDSTYLEENPPRYTKMEELKRTQNGNVFEEKEKREVEKRLKDLGYL
jgi:predicted AlkP superfamily phosphohydrolase/phosphomutase